KRGDARAGLALSPGVNAVNVEGKPLVRLRGKRSAVWIDLRGATAVDFHLQQAPKWFWEPDPKVYEGVRQHAVEGARGPNALAAAGWQTHDIPARTGLDSDVYWQVDSGW